MLTLTDLFCGAGGSSTGAVQVPGIHVRVAANHWRLAVETHNANHPEADHDCADISQVDPRRYPRTDILWASPSCTHHTGASGRKVVARGQGDLLDPAAPDDAGERSRATMWDAVRFAEHHQYAAIVVENVIEVTRWAPYRAWLMALDALGYDAQVVMLNSMHAQACGLPAAQSRDRWYCVLSRKGDQRPDVERVRRPRALCSTHGEVAAMQAWKRPDNRVGRYRSQYVYRCPRMECRNQVVEPGRLPASSIINWSLPGMRIGDRARPLAEKTMARIQAGIDRYAGEPFIAELRGGGSVARSVVEPLATVTASGSHHGLVTTHCGRDGTVPDALPPAVTTVERHALRNDSGGAEMVTPAVEPVRTITTSGHQSLLRGRATSIEDVYFRMLGPDEIKRAMAFPDDYRILGNRREQIRMSGNAVTPPAARDLLWAVTESLSAA